MTDKRSKS